MKENGAPKTKASLNIIHRADDESLKRLSPAFLVLLEFMQKRKTNQPASLTPNQTERR